MSRVRVGVHHNSRERFRLRELLALHSLWRGVESFPAASDAFGGTLLALSRDALVGKQQELITALDRHTPSRQRASEASVAHGAAQLREWATWKAYPWRHRKT